MTARKLIASWPVVRQLTGPDRLGLGEAAQSARSAGLEARTETADRVVASVCPYCAVGCGQRIYVKDEQVIQVEGDPDSPVSRGRLCPKGSATKELVTGPAREYRVKYRRPHGTDWEELDLDRAMDMIADRVIATRAATWDAHQPPHPRHRQPRRSDPRQRGELPHEEAVHRPGRGPGREPGPDMTLLHRPRSGDIVR